MEFGRLHLRNFLSLRDASIELGKFNVFIGPNASGKSNILKALRLLRNHVRFGIPVIEEPALLREPKIPFGDLVYNFDRYEDVEVEAEIKSGDDEFSYKLKLSAKGYSETIVRGSEVLYEHSSERPMFRYKAKNGEIKKAGSGSISAILVLRSPEGGIEERHPLLYQTGLKALPSDADEAVLKVSEFLRGVNVFRLDPVSIRFSNKISEEPAIRYDGSNLARYLLSLYLERRKDFGRVEDVIRGLVPEVDEVVPHIEGDAVEIWLKSEGLSLPLRPNYVSDGTLRLLAIASILNGGFSLVALEEPENHVHPYLLEALVDLARSSPSQVIFTTHSPYLLNHLKPEEVFLVGKIDSETRVRRLTEVEEFKVVKKYLEEGGTLGEAWYSRFFGGVE